MLQKYSIYNSIFYGLFCSFSSRKKKIYFLAVYVLYSVCLFCLFYCNVCSCLDSEDGPESSICTFFFVSPLCICLICFTPPALKSENFKWLKTLHCKFNV